MNPFLEREWHSRFRLRMTYIWLFLMVGAIAASIVWRYSTWFGASGQPGGADVSDGQIFGLLGADLFRFLGPLQVLVALLISPSLTAATLAGERERGTLDLLLLTRMSPWQIVWGRWFSGLAFAFLLLLALWPINVIILLLGGISPQQIGVVLALTAIAAIFGTALGLGVSAWRRRAHHSLRSANGIVVGWLIFSAIAANMSGLLFSSLGQSSFLPFFWMGLTNPVLAVLNLSWAFRAEQSWLWPALTMLTIAGLSLWSATIGLSKVQDEAPLIDLGPKPGQSGKVQPANTFEMPLLARWQAENPVFGRELRAKFRVRKPSLVILLAEGALALAVAVFYIWAFYQALTDPASRPIVFWGVYFTGLSVSLLACSTLGASAFAREYEAGTWESMKLSSLSASEIVWGKVGAIFLTPLLYSIPVWPLLLPCIYWKAGFYPAQRIPYDGVLPVQVLGALLIWLTSIWGMGSLAMWVGKRASKTSVATAWASGVGFLWTVLLPLGSYVVADSQGATDSFKTPLAATSPFSAIIGVINFEPGQGWVNTGIAFALVTLFVGGLLLKQICRELENDLPSRHS